MHDSLSRRDFQKQLLVAAAGTALGSSLAASAEAQQKEEVKEVQGKPQDGFIDAHVHVWTPDVEHYPLGPGFQKQEMKPASFTPEQLFAHARPSGVSRIVLIQMSFYGFDNTYMLDSMKRFPGVFSGVAIIDENDHPREHMKKLKAQGVRGFRIRPGSRPIASWLYGAGMAEMWKTGADENLAMCHLINPDSLPHVDKMCAKYPDTPVVIDHFARISVDGEIRKSDLDQLCNLARHPKTSVKISAYYALGKKKAPYTDLIPMIRRLLDAYGPERLMWASDGPYQVVEGHEYAPSIDLIKNLDGISESDRNWLLRGTAEKVFYHS